MGATYARVAAEGLVELSAWSRSPFDAPLVAASGRRLFLLCAVARPERVDRSLAGLGALVVGRCALPDHAALSPALCVRIELRAAAVGADAIVVTEKDAAGIVGGHRGGIPGRLPWLVTRTKLELEDDGRTLLGDFARRTGFPIERPSELES